MSPKLLGVCAAVLLAAAPACAAGQDNAAAPTGEAPQTRDRLSQDRMIHLVSEPMSIVQTAGLPAGKAALERLLAGARARHGARSVEVADLLTSFGVGLYNLSRESGDRRMREESIPYLQAAIPAYRAAFGDANPEVGVALTSYADAQTALNEDDPPQSVDAAREEAYRISLGAFGPTNLETLATLRYLAVLKGHPSRTRGEPARIEAAAALFRELISRSPNEAEADYLSAPAARTAFARMYAQNRMANEAREQLRLAIERVGSGDPLRQCFFEEFETARVESILAGENAGTRDPRLPALTTPDRCLALAVELPDREARQ